MCGIVGYVGKRPCRDLLIAGLEKLEYRGYDSAGISLLGTGRSTPCARSATSPTCVRRSASTARGQRRRRASRWRRRRRRSALAHTRWATHGRVTEENAHPHGDCDDSIHIVLNGIVENHAELRRELEAEGHRFSSETDAEIVAHLIESHDEGDLTEAVRAAFGELRGHYAFVAMHADHPDTLVARPPGVPADRRRWARARPSSPRRSPPSSPRPGDVLLVENGEIVTVDPGRRDDHRRRRQPRSSATSRRSPGTRTPPRRAAIRPSC